MDSPRTVAPCMLSRMKLFDMISYMLDLKFIRDNLPLILENTKKRNVDADPQKVVDLYEERNRVLQNTESLRQKRKRNAKTMKANERTKR